ncbi:MAG: hypothetical protein H5T33_00960 [Candidatus Methanosuratus sp.]|nr:hypothetical protein [Candidatus Methanosuratincola sp.]
MTYKRAGRYTLVVFARCIVHSKKRQESVIIRAKSKVMLAGIPSAGLDANFSYLLPEDNGIHD